jgi:hypothetical protein
MANKHKYFGLKISQIAETVAQHMIQDLKSRMILNHAQGVFEC